MKWSSLSVESVVFSIQNLKYEHSAVAATNATYCCNNQLAPGIKPEKEINATTTLHVDYNLNRGSFMYIIKTSNIPVAIIWKEKSNHLNLLFFGIFSNLEQVVENAKMAAACNIFIKILHLWIWSKPLPFLAFSTACSRFK